MLISISSNFTIQHQLHVHHRQNHELFIIDPEQERTAMKLYRVQLEIRIVAQPRLTVVDANMLRIDHQSFNPQAPFVFCPLSGTVLYCQLAAPLLHK